MLFLVIHLSATETLTCRREMSLIGSTYFGFAQNTIYDFQNTVLIVVLSLTNATKILRSRSKLIHALFQVVIALSVDLFSSVL